MSRTARNVVVLGETQADAAFRSYVDRLGAVGSGLVNPTAAQTLFRRLFTDLPVQKFGRLQSFANATTLNGALVPMLDPLNLGPALGYNWSAADYVAQWGGSKCGLGNTANTSRYVDMRIPQNRVMLDGANTGMFGCVVTGGPVPTGLETELSPYQAGNTYLTRIYAQLLFGGNYIRGAASGLSVADIIVGYTNPVVEPSFVGLHHYTRTGSSAASLRKNTASVASSGGIGSGAWPTVTIKSFGRDTGSGTVTSEFSKKTISMAFTGLDGAVFTADEYANFLAIVRDYHAALGVPTSTFA